MKIPESSLSKFEGGKEYQLTQASMYFCSH